MQKQKLFLTFFVLLAAQLTLWAQQNVVIRGVKYRLWQTADTATISGYGSNIGQDVVVPEQVQFAGSRFRVTAVEPRAFSDCRTVVSLSLPSSIKTIGANAFSGCRALTTLTLAEGLQSIGDDAFNSCRALKAVTIPNSVTTIGNYAFHTCESLKSLTLPDGLTHLGEWAFGGCSDLQAVALPTGLTAVSKGAFSNCNSLVSVTLPTQLTTIGERAFEECVELTGLSLPNSLTAIQANAFANCRMLERVLLPEGVTKLERGTFSGCGMLSMLALPQSLTALDEGALAGCIGLDTIVVRAAVPPTIVADVEPAVFDSSIFPTCRVLVPESQLSAYQAAEGWKAFALLQGQALTSISTAKTTQAAYAVYTLQGHKVADGVGHIDALGLPQGIYVVQGKKVAVRY